MPSSFRNLAAALLAVWAAGCAPDPAPALVSIRVAPIARSTLSTAEAFQLEATVEGSTDTRVEWLGVGVSPRGLFESATPGTFTVTAHCLADRGRAATATLRVVARPAVTAFTVEPPTLTAGEGAVLSWAVEGASTVLVDGVQQPGASLQVQPTSTRTYGLTVTNEAGLAVSAAVTVTVVAPPEIDAFTADHPAVTAGEPTALRWTTQGATDVRLDGEPVTGSALLLTPTQTKGYLLEARNALGFSVSRTVGIEVAPLPRILAFYPDAASLTAGESTALRWIVADAAQLSLDGSPVTGTSALIVPSATGEHQLEARNALGFAVTARTHVTVVPAPVIQAFSSDAATLTGGQSTTLRWTTSAASEVRLDGALVTSTALAITPLATTDYLLEAKNPAGFAVTSTVRVTVVPAPVIVTFTSDRPGITAGESTTLRWTTTGAADLRLDGTVVTGTSQPIAPATTTSFTLTATNAAGFAVTRTVNVAVVPAPVIVAFTADASTVTAGTGTTLRWTTTGTTEVRLNGTPVTGLSAAISPAATGAHTLEVKNAIGFTATQTLTVTVVPAAVIASFTAARVAVTQGESTQLSWSVSNAATLFVNGAAVTGSTLTVSPAATTAYTLEARNSIGSAVTAALTLTVVPPVALNFAASPASVVVGTPSTLSWTSAGAATLTLDGSTVGGNSLAVSPLRTTSYVLRATNSLGFETSQTLTLTVAPYPGVVWSAAGQVWLRWNDSPALTGTQTWDIYRSTSPITTLSSATRVGRLLPEDVHAARLKLADTTATWVLPTAAGGTTTLGATEAHFTWTPRTAETSFFAVVPSGSSTPVVRFGPVDETVTPVTAHVQLSGIDAASGLAYSDYALWLDGRAGAATGRADFPVMGPPSFNGLATLFRVYASPAAASSMPAMLVLHGNGGSWLDHRPVASNDAPDFSLSKGLVTAVDDAFVYTSGSTVSTGTTRWFGAWDGFDRFNPSLTTPPNGVTVHAYALRRLLWIRDWLVSAKGVDADRVLIGGHSMGGLGAVTATRAFPDKFAGTLAYQCHTRVPSGFGDFLRGTEAQNLTTSLGATMVDVHDPAVLLSATQLPPMHFIWGTTDNMIPWADKPATIAQLSALKRGHQIWWDNRTHGYPWVGRFVGSVGLRAESLLKLRRNQSYPAFSAEVSPDASTANSWGTQGGYLEWDPDALTESATAWTIELWLRSTAAHAADVPAFATVTVDVSVRRPQTFLPAAGAARSWSLRRVSDNALLQSGTLTVGAGGLVTVQALVVPKERARLTVGP